MNRLISALIAVAVVLAFLAAPAVADWYVGDGHKMHFPQLPDPYGWDVEISSYNNQHELADDWKCSSSGPVGDIHFWYSVNNDGPTVIEHVAASIYSDDRTGVYSKPGDLLWSQTFDADDFSVIKDYGTGLQGFADPQDIETWITGVGNHNWYHQINITEIDDPFIQEVDTIYWLGLYVWWEGTQEPVGWKTSKSPLFEDTAVYRTGTDGNWIPLDETNGAPYPLDLAFVITPEPGTFVLLAMAGISALFFVWRKRRAA